MEFIAQTEQLPSMIAFVATEARSVGIQGEKLLQIELATEEALVNVIRYAYPEPESTTNKVDVTCNYLNTNQFVVIIRDFGKPFNPQEKKVDLQLGVPVEDREIGGLGIHMIRQLTETLHYERKGNQNIFSMTFS